MTAVSHVVIVGGGLAGWTAAASLANSMRGGFVQVTVADVLPPESAVQAEYLRPSTLAFFRHLGIRESDVLAETDAALRLGTGLADWPRPGARCVLPFGKLGAHIGFIPFHHYLVKRRLSGQPAAFADYSINAVAAQRGRFTRPSASATQAAANVDYGLTLDRQACRNLLRRYALQTGVKEVHGALGEIDCHADGRIRALTLDGERTLAGDLFFDCSGDIALLAGGVLGEPANHGAGALPADRMLSVSAKKSPSLLLQCSVQDGAWRVAAALGNRSVYSLIYSSARLADDAAASQLTALPGAAADEGSALTPLPQGTRARPWTGNCVALGAAAGLPVPLLVSELHWLAAAMRHFLQLFPGDVTADGVRQEFNAAHRARFDAFHDYLSLLYATAQRNGNPAFADVAMPPSLRSRRELFRCAGRRPASDVDEPTHDEWVTAWLSAGTWPESFDPLLGRMPDSELDNHFARLAAAIDSEVQRMDEVAPPFGVTNGKSD